MCASHVIHIVFDLQVAELKTLELCTLLGNQEFNFRFGCGNAKPTNLIELKDASDIVHAVWLHYVLFLPHLELEQLM